jgi:hypothetical protein
VDVAVDVWGFQFLSRAVASRDAQLFQIDVAELLAQVISTQRRSSNDSAPAA